LFGFYCEVDGSKEITLDKDELAVAEWFEREEIPVHQKTVSLTNEMILNFKDGNWKY
jgi:NAD+ diphosphatase